METRCRDLDFMPAIVKNFWLKILYYCDAPELCSFRASCKLLRDTIDFDTHLTTVWGCRLQYAGDDADYARILFGDRVPKAIACKGRKYAISALKRTLWCEYGFDVDPFFENLHRFEDPTRFPCYVGKDYGWLDGWRCWVSDDRYMYILIDEYRLREQYLCDALFLETCFPGTFHVKVIAHGFLGMDASYHCLCAHNKNKPCPKRSDCEVHRSFQILLRMKLTSVTNMKDAPRRLKKRVKTALEINFMQRLGSCSTPLLLPSSLERFVRLRCGK
jgi:hypothetical protein